MKVYAGFDEAREYLEECTTWMNDDYNTKANAIIEVLTNAEKHLKGLDFEMDGIEVVVYGVQKTTGGMSGQGISFLVEATAKGKNGNEDFILCKISDHSKFDHEITLFDWCDENEIKERLSVENIIQVIEDDVDLEELRGE